MIKRFYALLLSLLLLVACAPLEYRVAEPSLINPIFDATAAIVKPRKDGMYYASCSAVWVSDDELLTAAHCVEEKVDYSICESMDDFEAFMNCVIEKQAEKPKDPMGRTIEFASFEDAAGKSDNGVIGTVRAGKVVKYDYTHDLALVKSDDAGHHTIALISDRHADIGDVVHIVGHTQGLPWSYTPGVVGAVRMMDNFRDSRVHVIQVVSGASYGNSGGAVFDGHGGVLGIASFRVDDTPIVLFTHTDELKAFLNK